MPMALTCDCGARFEVDETLAGRTVCCPECRTPLEAPAAATAARPRTSLFALGSVVLALAGGFTVLGGAAAVVLGVIGLVHIRRLGGRLTGAGLAIAGIALGVGFSAVTVFLLTWPDLVPLDAWFR